MKKLKIRYQSRYKPRHKISNQAGYDVLGKLKQKKLYRKKWFRINDKTTPFLKYSHRSSLERLYGERLRAKQVLRQTYGKLTERQFKTIFHKSEFGYSKSKRSLKGLLDRRLDAFIFRLGYATSIFKARQDIILGLLKSTVMSLNLRVYLLLQGIVFHLTVMCGILFIRHSLHV